MLYIHLFNPGHETAILHGSENYTPGINVQRMTKELSTLPIWYAEEGDYVYSETPNPSSFLLREFRNRVHPVSAEDLLQQKNSLPELSVHPWGLSPHSCGYFKHLARQGVPLILPEWKEDYKRLTGRQTAAHCLTRLHQQLPDKELPEVPHFCTSINEARQYIQDHEQSNFVLKSPFSSSGRGVLWMSRDKWTVKDEQWMSGVLRRQQTFSIEPALPKVRDFAMEFYSDGKGNVQYEGLSLFSTAEQGAYSGNLLGSQDYLLQQLIQYEVVDELRCYKEKLLEILKEVYASIYQGYLGVDMLVYQSTDEKTFQVHPCIEINMRYTMGVVALQLSRKLLAERSIGNFAINFNGRAGETYRKHCEMQKQFPLQMEKGKIHSGYLPLCPIEPETGYMAYILVKAESAL